MTIEVVSPQSTQRAVSLIRHEPWCMFVAPIVLYAYEIVADPSKLTIGDALVLHACVSRGTKTRPVSVN
jgi:hypothetical protein